jgi:signal transduction histidine kinase
MVVGAARPFRRRAFTVRSPIPVVYGIAGFGVLLGVVGLVLKVRHHQHSLVDTVLGGVGGFGFLCAGVVAHTRQPANRVGLLMVLVGTAFFAEDLQMSGIAWVHSVGLLLASASSGFTAHLILAFPSGRLGSRLARLLVGAAYAAVFVLAPATVLFGVTWPTPNLLLVVPDAGVNAQVGNACRILGAVVAVGMVAVLLARWVAAGLPMRRVLAPVFLSGLVGGAGTVVYGVLGGADPVLSASRWVYQVAFCLLPLGYLAWVGRVRLGRTALGSLLGALREPLSPSELRAALARALGDPSLQVGYWRPAAEVFVDGDGRPLAMPSAGSGRAATLVERDGRRVAALVHDAALHEDGHVLTAVTGAAGLALENQRLAAEVRAQLAEVRASRGRIVAAADAERRRLERDLHDGAQPRLVTAVLSLRLAQQRLDGVADAATAALLANSAAGLDAAIVELREFARGIHPAILTDAGLLPAIQALVERSPLDVRLVAAAMPRLSPALEAAAYFVVAEAMTNALKHARAEHVRITVEHSADLLRIDVTDDGVGGADIAAGSGLLGLLDRVSALDGGLTVHSVPGRGTSVSAALPRGSGGNDPAPAGRP